MVDRSRNNPPNTRNKAGWWKARDQLGWEALLVGIDINHLQSFAEGIYHTRTIDELIEPAGNELQKWHRLFPSNCIHLLLNIN